MTKKQLIKSIIEMEYTKEELENVKELFKVRYSDLAKYNKQFLQERATYLENKER